MSDTPVTLENIDPLLLQNQLCFPLYAASRLLTRLYQPMLEPLGLTYPQYIVLLILWEDGPSTVSHIGKRAQLATNTLTPLLKRLEALALLTRERRSKDERVVNIVLTAAGEDLRAQCACIPMEMFQQVGYPIADSLGLKRQLDAFLLHLESLTPGC
jgi:DNA-binding MarR family transcriptional regulator